MASFSSLNFILRFLPIFLLVYYLVPTKAKRIVSIIGSLIFYAFGDLLFLPLIIFLTVINYLIGSSSFKVDRLGDINVKQRERKRTLILALIIDISVLILFKIGTVFFDLEYWPLGLSFYIFKMISYQIDVKRRNISEKPSFIETVDYFLLFPQVMQGPIMCYADNRPQWSKSDLWVNIENGAAYFVAGFAMKTYLADRIGILWKDLGMYGYDSISTPLAYLGAFSYSFELYFDFWGYSLMASGIMVAMGYKFIRNFDNPYASRSVSDFYRRWHMTLGSFFKDYIYIPMGGNRCSKGRLVLNLAIVWLLTGIWHGNGINFVIWGLVLGVFVILEKLLWGKYIEKTFLGNIYVLIIIPITWVIFAIRDIPSGIEYFKRLFPFWGSASYVNNWDVIDYLKSYWMLFAIAILLCIPPVVKLLKRIARKWYGAVALLILFWVAAYFSASGAVNPFMYLDF